MCIVASCVVGMAYWIIENKEDGSDLDRESSINNASVACFGAILLFTGGGGPAPRTFPGLFLLLGWSLFILVVINGYAANLVAFLVKKAPPLFPMTDIADGSARGLPICVWTSSAMGPVMKELYPTLKVVSCSSTDLLTKLDEGKCDGAVLVQDSWRVQGSLKKYNENCDKARVGGVIHPSSSGWAVGIDAGKCEGQRQVLLC